MTFIFILLVNILLLCVSQYITSSELLVLLIECNNFILGIFSSTFSLVALIDLQFASLNRE